jgi:hypothetical protein
VAEVFVQFTEPVVGKDGTSYMARACGQEADHLWHGWIEFLPSDSGQPVHSARETTQPNRRDLEYWATGLTAVYLEGALDRALNPFSKAAPSAAMPAMFRGPASTAALGNGLASATSAPPRTDAVLNPFSVYRKGEAVLRRQLAALSAWHLVNIIAAHDLSTQSPEALTAMAAPTLVELIISAVREEAGHPSRDR